MKDKIYLAGPDVFRVDAKEHLEKLKVLCAKYGYSAISPFDNESTSSEDIFYANTKLIDKCDILIANIEPFRGPNVDDGTAFEIGYAYAKDKRIYGYTPTKETTLYNLTKSYGAGKQFPIVEQFDLPRNLMIVHAIEYTGGTIETSFEEVLKQLK